MEVDVPTLRRAWLHAGTANLWCVQDYGHAVIEYPPPRETDPEEDVAEKDKLKDFLPTATFRLFVDFDDAHRYREQLVDRVTADNVSVADTLARFKIHQAPLHAYWNDFFEVQMMMNEHHVHAVLDVVLSQLKTKDDFPKEIDTLFSETTLYC